MLLIGQYDSPFVRRVAIALRHYQMPFEHQPWSVFADAQRIARYNPLRRVPTLVLDDGEVLTDSATILDVIDERVGEQRALLPRQGALRREGLRLVALLTGVADKAVSAYLEGHLRTAPSELWLERCQQQIEATLDWLEADRARRTTTWWLGAELSHVDITFGCTWCHLREAHPRFTFTRWPALLAHSARCDALAGFQELYQPFIVTLSRSAE
jgi:glutathione S-transferase